MAVSTPHILTEVTFTVDSSNYQCAVRRVQLTPNTPIQEYKVLCPGGSGTAAGNTTWQLEVEYYQNWDDDDFARFLDENPGDTASFVFTQNGLTKSGNIIVVPGPVGGTVDEFATATVTLPVVGTPSSVYPS
jgi:hypothetical protein